MPTRSDQDLVVRMVETVHDRKIRLPRKFRDGSRHDPSGIVEDAFSVLIPRRHQESRDSPLDEELPRPPCRSPPPTGAIRGPWPHTPPPHPVLLESVTRLPHQHLSQDQPSPPSLFPNASPTLRLHPEKGPRKPFKDSAVQISHFSYPAKGGCIGKAKRTVCPDQSPTGPIGPGEYEAW